MPPKKGGVTAQLTEAVGHLDRLVNLMIEWQTDWRALTPHLPSGALNPDYDPEYVDRIRANPEEIFDPALLAARDFLKRIHLH